MQYRREDAPEPTACLEHRSTSKEIADLDQGHRLESSQGYAGLLTQGESAPLTLPQGDTDQEARERAGQSASLGE